MFPSATVSTRRAKPSHEPWVPHDYQLKSVDFLCGQNSAALFLDPGLGKTSIVLAAFDALRNAGHARKMLVIAPLRVIQTVWRQEAQKWTQFRHLRFSVLHGTNKKDRLKDDADIWLINPEGIKWLGDQFFGRNLPFDTVVIDELTKFKNHKAVRSKSLRPRLRGVRRRWGLTGTPVPNGYMDLFGQFLILDDGAALGKYITHYRDTYFQPDFNGFDYILQPGASKRIEAKIAPYVMRMDADAYLKLPRLIDDPRYVELSPEARATYNAMKKTMLAELPEGTVTAANAAAVYSKLKQMANGAVYINEAHEVAHVHDALLDAVEDLVEELCGAPLLLAYEFNHDLSRLQKRFPNAPYIGAGVSEKQLAQIVADWNAGKIPLLLAHPASAGHGLNLQGCSAQHIGWFGPIWDLELYLQFIMRVLRQGNDAPRVLNHLFMVKDTIHGLAMDALGDKNTTQERLLSSLSTVLHDAGTHTAGSTAANGEQHMKLSKQGQGGSGGNTQPAPQEQTRALPKGWGNPADAQAKAAEAQAEIAQRQAVAEKIAPQRQQEAAEQPPASERARSAFSPGISQTLNGGANGHAKDVEVQQEPEAKPTRTRTRAPKETEAAAGPIDAFTIKDQIEISARLQILSVVAEALKGSEAEPADYLTVARDFTAFVLKG